jgi:hypothetical protein
MSEEQPLQGNCEQCGGLLEFPAEWIGAQVACPLCGAPTDLHAPTPDAEPEVAEEESLPVPCARRWPLVIGVVCSLLLLSSVAAWILWKQRGGTKLETGNPAPASAAIAEEMVLVTAPTLGMFQGGVKAEDLRAGRELFVSRCSECHNLHDPATYSASEWGGILASMRGKAKLSSSQAEQLNRFFATVRP